MLKKVAVALLALVVIVLLVAPIVMGFVLERTHAEILRAIRDQSQGRYQIEGTIERGWLGSTAETLITLAGDTPDESFIVPLSHEISHGPIPLAGALLEGEPLHLAVAFIDTRYAANPDVLPNIAAALGSRPLLVLRAWLGFDQTARLLIHSPGFSLEDGSFSTEGLRVDADIDPAARSLVASLRQGPLRLEGAGTTLRLDETTMNIETTQALSGDESVATVEGRVDLGTISLRDGAQRAELAASVIDFSGQAIGPELTDSSLDMRLGDIEVFASGSAEVLTHTIRGIYLKERSGHDRSSGWRSFDTTLSFESLQLGSRRYGPGSAVSHIRNIDAPAWRALGADMSALGDRNLSEEEMSQQRVVVLGKHMAQVLGPAPELVIEQLKLQTATGGLEGSARFGVDTSDPMALSMPFMLMFILQAKAGLSIDFELMHELVDAYLASTVADDAGTMSEEEILEMAGFMRMGMLGSLLADGRLVSDEAAGKYRLDIELREGLPILNGQPADPSFLSGVVPGF